MPKKYIFQTLCILVLPLCIDGDTAFLNHIANYIKLVSAYNYDNEYDTVDVIPLEDVSRIMEVNVDVSLFAINGFDEVVGKMDLVVAMNMSWIDEMPLITSSIFRVDGRESFLVPHEKIWTPKLVLKNAVGEVTEVGDSSYPCSFNMNTYRVTWKPRLVISGACTPDVTYYPFDKQTCAFTFAGWGFYSDEMLLTTASDEWDITNYEPNGEWTIIETSSETFIEDNQSSITFTITVARKPLYFAFNIIMPVMILCCLNSVVFLLPAESGERVGFSITCLLSFMVLLNMVMDIMPRSSSPISYLCFYLVIMMCNSGAMTLVTILLLRVYFKPEKEKVPKWMSSAVIFLNCGCSRLKCCMSVHKCLTEKCCPCKTGVHSSEQPNKITVSNKDDRRESSEKNTLLTEITEENKDAKRKHKSQTIEKNITKPSAENKLPDNAVKPENHLTLSGGKLRKAELYGHTNVASPDYQKLDIPDPVYPESPRLKFRKFLKGDILLEPIFNDQPFKIYFKPKLMKKYNIKRGTEWNCFQFLKTKVRDDREVTELGNKNKLTSFSSLHANDVNEENTPASNSDKASTVALKHQNKSDKLLTRKRKRFDNSNEEDESDINLNANRPRDKIDWTRIDKIKSPSIETESFTSSAYSDFESEGTDLEELEETVAWSDVGRILDTFFFLAFLGAQIFFTVVFFVPIATN